MDVNQLHERAFARDLRSRNRSPSTITNYLEAMQSLARYLDGGDLADVTPDVLLGYFDAQVAAYKPAGVGIRFRALQQFYKWAAAEEVVESNPMGGLRPPLVPPQPVPVVPLDQIRALLKACDGKGFVERRDTAIIRLFLEPGGLRLAEQVGLGVNDVDFGMDVVLVLGKGRKPRSVPFGAKTGQALERYVRLRAKHPDARLPELWLGPKGPLTRSGVAQMLRRRAAQGGLPPGLHPHMLRHTAAHEWFAADGSETDAMKLFGWDSREMPGRYGGSVAGERAKASARRLSLGDRY